MVKDIIRIGTRSSKLALWQANWVKEQIEGRYPRIECKLEKIKTKGDRITDVPLAKVGGKGLFVKEIEDALIEAKVDIAVHSMKDVPTALPEGLQITAITKREDYRDALISKNNLHLIDMPSDSKIGTSSLRRQAQLLNIYPDFQMVPLRGNLDTRLKKLITSSLDAIVVAGAGVKRLGLQDRITEYISPEIVLPAIGQGALGIESRIDNNRINRITGFLNSPDSEITITAERQFLGRLGGGCQVPIAALGEIHNGVLSLCGIVSSIDGKILLRDRIQGSPDNPTFLGERLAQRLLYKGAAEVLGEIYPTAY
ncbi:MAG: hydroxymethylbilane synthase [Thermodesulfobacteriota bacterium]|nr:hydroxymethylbilane synthase [Thermodesulfobacteriota bacterium]